jgi:acyl-CoA thioesterase I
VVSAAWAGLHPGRRTPGSRRAAPARHIRLGRSALLLALLVAAVLVAGCGQRGSAAASCRLPAGATVLAIGDSLTRGHGAEGQGYAEQLQPLLAAQPGRQDLRVVNLGVNGETSAALAARIDAALAEHRPAVVLMTSGGNDFLRRAAEEDTRRHLADVVGTVRAAGAYPVLFAVPQPSLAAAVGLPSDHPMYGALAEALKLPVLPGVVAGVLAKPELKSDQIHPNAAGYAVMAQAAAEALAACR